MSILSAALLLFLVLDPVGNIPLFLCALQNVDEKRHRWVILRELLFGLFFLLLFLFAGRYILYAFHISKSALSIAGGVVLFLIAIKMIFAATDEIFSVDMEGEPYLVPLAIPLIAGPSAMTMVLLMMAGDPSRWLDWLIAVLLAWAMTSSILLFSGLLRKILKKRGITAMARLMGMILVTVAVEMLVSGIKQSFFQ